MTHPTEPKLPESLEAIRAALDAGPTPGQWRAGINRAGHSFLVQDSERRLVCSMSWHHSSREHYALKEESEANALLISACNPEAITALLDALKARDAEIERLRGVISDHNADCESQCEQRQQSGDAHCPYAKYGRQCPDCPRDGMLDPSAIDQARATGGEKAK